MMRMIMMWMMWIIGIVGVGVLGWGIDPASLTAQSPMSGTTVTRSTDYRLQGIAIARPHVIPGPSGGSVVGVATAGTYRRTVLVTPITDPTIVCSIATVADQDLQYVHVASWSDDTGNSVLVWNDPKAGTVSFVRRAATGRIGTPITLWDQRESFPVEPAITRLTDGRFLVVWRAAGIDGRLRYRVGTPDAASWSDPQIVHPTPGYRSPISLTAPRSGDPIAWLTYTAHQPTHPDPTRRVQTCLVPWNGTTFTDPEPIAVPEGSLVDATIRRDPVQDRLVIGGRIVDRGIVVVMRPASAAPTTPWTTVHAVWDRTAESPMLAYDASGDLHLTWTAGEPLVRTVFYRLIHRDGWMSSDVPSVNAAPFFGATVLPPEDPFAPTRTVTVAYALVFGTTGTVNTRIMQITVQSEPTVAPPPPPAGPYHLWIPIVMRTSGWGVGWEGC